MIDAKVSFMNQMEIKLFTEVTADAMGKTMKVGAVKAVRKKHNK